LEVGEVSFGVCDLLAALPESNNVSDKNSAMCRFITMRSAPSVGCAISEKNTKEYHATAYAHAVFSHYEQAGRICSCGPFYLVRAAAGSEEAASCRASKPLMAHIPRSGPIAMQASAHCHPKCEARAAIERIEIAVRRKPIEV